MLTLLAPTVLARATLHDILASLDRVLCDAPASRFADARLEWETFLEALERDLPAAATAGHPNHPSHRVTYFTRAFPSTFRGDLPEGPAPWIAGVSVVGLRQSLDDPEQKWTVARERKVSHPTATRDIHPRCLLLLGPKRPRRDRVSPLFQKGRRGKIHAKRSVSGLDLKTVPGLFLNSLLSLHGMKTFFSFQCEILLPATEFSKLALRIQCQMSPVFLSALHQGDDRERRVPRSDLFS